MQLLADLRRVALAFVAAIAIGFYLAFAFSAVMGTIAMVSAVAHGRDLDGRYAQSDLRDWFNGLKSKGGSLCCSDADGRTVKDVDWDTQDGHYRVRLDGAWIVVPDSAVIDVPNRASVPIVWPFFDGMSIKIRCFIPGTQS